MIRWIEMNNQFALAIIGGGPAGIMAALAAIKSPIVLIEKNEAVGRKILATGNGRCNLTNRFAEVSRYHGGDPKFIEGVLKKFNQFAVMKYFENLGVVLKEEDYGRIFPRTNQAQTIVDALTHKLTEKKILVKTNCDVKKINKTKNGFEIVTRPSTSLDNARDKSLGTSTILARKIVLATGGKAAAHLGTTGDGYYWAELLGHKITPIFPALVPLETVEAWPKEISGLRVEGKSTVTIDGKIISEKSGDILFTHFGLSAPAVMAHAGTIAPHLGKNVQIHLDLFPETSEKELDNLLAKIFASTGKKSLKNSLSGLIANNLSPMILKLLELSETKKTAEVSKIDRIKIARRLKDLTLQIKGLRPFKEAQVTSGGMDLSDIDINTLESKKTPGLYFAGEILDVNGDSGGFNLQ